MISPEPSSSSFSSSSSFIDPPSYADTLFIRASSSKISSASSKSPRPPTSDFLHISVSDPLKHPDSHFSYLITTRHLTAPSPFTLRRRFRDFVTLADRLADSHRGLFIPLRPDKNVVEGQTPEFVEQRREALEKYLRRLAAHPVLGRSAELAEFLTEEEGKLSPMVATGGRDLWRMIRGLKQSVANDWGGGKMLAVEEDKEFLERKERTQELALQLNATSEKAEALVKAQHDIGETMGELGLALIKLIKLENDEAVHMSQRVGAADTKTVATAAVKASRFYRELNSQTIKHLETMHEYMGLMLSIRNAFSERSDSLLTLQTLLSDLASLRSRDEKLEAAAAKVFGRDESRIQKLEEIKKTIIVTEDAKECASREYEKIKENNRNEFERFDRERQDDFLSMLRGLAINQAGYFEKIADVWGTVANETSHYAAK